MAPKKAAKRVDEDQIIDKIAAEQQAQQKECERLKNVALDAGVLTDEIGRVTTQLPLSKALVKANGKDVVKKSSTRKNRYMVIVNALLAPAAAGRMGTLAQLDSRNPVMYLEFPEGRLKLFGTLVFPRAKYMALRMGGRDSVMAEDVFDNLLVFSEAWWIGMVEENPEEKRLPMPPHLQHPQEQPPVGAAGPSDGVGEPGAKLPTRTVHTNYDFAYGAGPKPGEAGGAQKDAQVGAAEADFLPPSSQRAQRASRKRIHHECIDSDDEGDIPGASEGSGDDSGDNGGGGDRALKRRTPAAAASAKAAGPASGGAAATGMKGFKRARTERGGIINVDAAVATPREDAPLPRRAAAVRAAAAVARSTRGTESGSEEDEEEKEQSPDAEEDSGGCAEGNSDDDDSDEDGRRRSARKRTTPAAKGKTAATPRGQHANMSGHKATAPSAKTPGATRRGKAAAAGPIPVIMIGDSDNEDTEAAAVTGGEGSRQRPASVRKGREDGGLKTPGRGAGGKGRLAAVTPMSLGDEDADEREQQQKEDDGLLEEGVEEESDEGDNDADEGDSGDEEEGGEGDEDDTGDGDEDEEGAEEEEEGNDERGITARTQATRSTGGGRRKSVVSPGNISDVIVVDGEDEEQDGDDDDDNDDDDDDEGEGAGKAVAGRSAREGGRPRGRNVGRGSKMVAGEAAKSSTSGRGKRASAVGGRPGAKKRQRVADSEEEEEEEEEEESESAQLDDDDDEDWAA